jgi:Zn-dependent M32 family carboxypeptidase
MNKQRREEINKIIQDLFGIKTKMETVLAEEENAFDSMPEGLQSSERGMNSEDAIDILSESVDKLKEIIDELSEIM